MKKLFAKRLLLLVAVTALMVLAVGVGCASADPVTWNPNDKGDNTVLSNNNLTFSVPTSADYYRNARATSAVSTTTGKFYWEVHMDSTYAYVSVGVGNSSVALNTDIRGITTVRGIFFGNNDVYYNRGLSDSYSYGQIIKVGDTIGIALDLDSDTISFYKNGGSSPFYTASNVKAIGSIYPLVQGYINTGGVTANFGATPFTYSMPAGYQAYGESVQSTKTLDITAVDTASVGGAITADIVINGATNIYAEDIKVTYDTDRLTYVDYTEIAGLKVYSATEPTPGTLRFIVASQGAANVVNGTKTLLTLNFTAKAAGDALVDITAGRIADTTQETDVSADQCGEKIITIEGASDVNRSGEFTLLDLAIDAWYHGKTAAETDTTLYNADVIIDNNIDDLDLTEIVNKMLQNTNYAPNNS